jgi:lipopolysaccharide biosynthesis glycosyltransferase
MKICITTAYDRNYKEAGKTLFNSIRRHTNCEGIDFKVITSDLEVLKELGKENCHFVTPEIKLRYKNVKYIKELPVEKYASSWYRFEIFNMPEYDRVICIDSDCICVQDISYLFSEELNEYDLISVEDHIVSKVFTKCMDELEKQQLCNLINLRKRIKDGKVDIQPALLVANKSIVNKTWYTKLLNYANTSPFSYSIDEGVLNDFIYMDKLKIKLLPLEWDYQDCYETNCPELAVPSNPIIIHCQESKPFKKQKINLDKRMHKWHDLWWEENKPIKNSKESFIPVDIETSITIKNSVLDKIAIKHESDKSSRFHNYAVKYDKILSPYRDTFKSILEIGVSRGQSVSMWADYFSKAIIHGADISKASQICEAYSDRIKFHLLDQRNESQLKNMKQFSPFDLIIDDGNHFWHEQILTFNTIFSFLKSGGIYIVEDTTTSYWKEYKNYTISPTEYFKTLVDDINLKGARGAVPKNPPIEFGGFKEGWHRREDCHVHVPAFESIQFMNGFIVIYKR